MVRGIGFVVFLGALAFASCAKKEASEAPRTSTEAPAAQPAGGPHAFIHLKTGSQVGGSIVASSQVDMIVAGDDGIEHKIPMAQIQSVEYAAAQPVRTAGRSAREPGRPQTALKDRPVSPSQPVAGADRTQPISAAPTPAAPVPATIRLLPAMAFLANPRNSTRSS